MLAHSLTPHSPPTRVQELKNATYQVRAYGVGAGAQSFSTARITAVDWSEATSKGFGANFVRLLRLAATPQSPPALLSPPAPPPPPPTPSPNPPAQAYISGANTKGVKIPMTAPVLSRNVGGSGDSWLVSFFTPQSIYPDLASTPQPTAANMYIDPLPLSNFAVLEFPGEANGISYAAQKEKLVSMLIADNVTMAPASDDFAVAYAGYDAPNDLFNRHNEVWVKILL